MQLTHHESTRRQFFQILLSVCFGLIILCLMGILDHFDLYAQSSLIKPNEMLVYLHDSESALEYVGLMSDYTYIYSIPSDKCSLISPNGQYIIQTPTTLQGDLKIFRLLNVETIVEIAWQSGWEPCNYHWVSDTIIGIGNTVSSSEYYYFDIAQGNFVPTSYQPPPSPSYPDLPNWLYNTDENFILASPVQDIYLYQRCNSGQSSGSTCIGETDLVIYDVGQQIEIGTLENPNMELITGFAQADSSRALIGYGSIAWSPDGRFIVYESSPEFLYDETTLRIYDTVTSSSVEIDEGVTVDPTCALQWSPDSRKLAFWTIGRGGEPLPTDNLATLKRLIVYDVINGDVVLSDQPFNLQDNRIESVGLWSPNGTNYAFIDVSQTLYHVDAITGFSSVLDTNVIQIISWYRE